ncbi:NHL repeat-containing protein 2 [Hordeum vulgare]|nr:NHL repeat-containing protein 2 [Hordeum vulgare]
MKHEVDALAATWQSCRARRFEAGLPASSLEVSDDEDDTMMGTGFDDTAPAPVPLVQSGYTMAQAHYNTIMAEGKPASAPTSLLDRALEQHRLVLGHVNGERVSQEALAAMAATNPNLATE